MVRRRRQHVRSNLRRLRCGYGLGRRHMLVEVSAREVTRCWEASPSRPETSGCRCKARTCRARSNDRASGWSCDQTATASVLWQGPAWRAGRLMPMRSQEPGWCGRTRAATIPRHSHTALHRPLRMRQPGPRLAASGEHPGQRGTVACSAYPLGTLISTVVTYLGRVRERTRMRATSLSFVLVFWE